MKREELLHIIGMLDDDIVNKAENEKPPIKRQSRRWVKWTVIAACLSVIVIGGLCVSINIGIFPPGSGAGGSGHGEGTTFMHYAGPVLPLNMIGDTKDLTADRSIAYDFSSLAKKDENTPLGGLRVTEVSLDMEQEHYFIEIKEGK